MIHHIEPPRRITAYGCKYAAIYAACMALMLTVIAFLWLFITRYPIPFGIQIATVITYTLLAGWQTFGYQRYGIAYNLFDPAVKRVLPRISLTFIQFACIIWLLVTLYHSHPRFSQKISHFDDTCIALAMLIGTLHIYLARRILSRSGAGE